MEGITTLVYKRKSVWLDSGLRSLIDLYIVSFLGSRFSALSSRACSTLFFYAVTLRAWSRYGTRRLCSGSSHCGIYNTILYNIGGTSKIHEVISKPPKSNPHSIDP
jgi:hypothetical protein